MWCKKQWNSYYSRLQELRFGQTQDKHINQAAVLIRKYRPGEAYAQLFRFVIFSVALKKYQRVKQTIVLLLKKLSILTSIPSAYNATCNSKRGTTVCMNSFCEKPMYRRREQQDFRIVPSEEG